MNVKPRHNDCKDIVIPCHNDCLDIITLLL